MPKSPRSLLQTPDKVGCEYVPRIQSAGMHWEYPGLNRLHFSATHSRYSRGWLSERQNAGQSGETEKTARDDDCGETGAVYRGGRGRLSDGAR